MDYTGHIIKMDTKDSSPIEYRLMFGEKSVIMNDLIKKYIILKYENEINDLSLIVYINTSVSNWIAQLYLIFFDTPELPFFYTKMLYSMLVLVIVSDDIFLMKYLYNYKRLGVK